MLCYDRINAIQVNKLKLETSEDDIPYGTVYACTVISLEILIKIISRFVWCSRVERYIVNN